MANNELRTSMQNEAVNRLLTNRRLIVEWGTGVGKSRVAINAAKAVSAKGNMRILLLVTETAHKKNWRNEFSAALGSEGEKLYESMTVECYASLPKYEGTHWDFIIADEAHHLRSEKRVDIIESMGVSYFLCMSATLSDNNDAEALVRMLNDRFGKFEVMNFGLQDAIDAEILAEPDVKVHILELNQIREMQTVHVYWGFKNARREFHVDIDGYVKLREKRNDGTLRAADIYVTCTAAHGYRILDDMFEYVKEKRKGIKEMLDDPYLRKNEQEKIEKELLYAGNELKRIGDDRQDYLGELKTVAARMIFDSLAEKKFIGFCSSLEQGTVLNAGRLLSSKKRKKVNAAIIDEFNEGKARCILAVNMLIEGANLNGIDAAVVVQLGRKSRKFVQELGRVMRSSDPEIHLILFNHTVDIGFYEASVSEIIDPKYTDWIYNELPEHLEKQDFEQLPAA